jgi:hypothetical protein
MKRFTIIIILTCTFMVIMYSQSVCEGAKKSVSGLPSNVETKHPGVSSSHSGKVTETMNSGGYTYVCIVNNGVKTWFAIPETKVSIGQEMSFRPGGEMLNFKSKSLNRTFDRIIFSSGPVRDQGDLLGRKSMGSKKTVISSNEKIKVKKASGSDGYTVAEIYTQRTRLDKKQVSVRGKVVKVSAGIMGKNWVHIQDGTGDQSGGSNNLIVTTQDLPSVGDIVTAQGTIYKDKDFGSGYKYGVIMEEASIKK